ncbi:hypothetical protein F5141DRAFT_1217965 [Pisolithus sp. B1]|nr:hypothetical protein F5141DRAFT_1217965 [Pisolithus sp. B1]
MAGLAQQIADPQQEPVDNQQENQQLVAGLQQQQAAVTAIEAQRVQWATLPGDVIQRRIEVMADPGLWDGKKAQFAEWWVKMRVWVMQNANALPTPQDKATASEVEWACKQLRELKQGSSQFEDFFAKFDALHLQLNAPDAYAAILLEQVTNPSIIQNAMLAGYPDGNWTEMVPCFKSVALALECHHLIFGTPTTSSSSCPSHPFQCGFSNMGTQPGAGALMEIGAMTSSCPVPSCIGCFACGGNHFKCDCPRQSSTSHMPPFCPCPAIHQVVPDQDPNLAQVQGMYFEEMKAFFYDRQVNKMRVQGKEFSQ